MVSIPKSEIVSITVCYGQSVEKPILQMIAGVLTSLLGFFMGVWPLVGYITILEPRKAGLSSCRMAWRPLSF